MITVAARRKRTDYPDDPDSVRAIRALGDTLARHRDGDTTGALAKLADVITLAGRDGEPAARVNLAWLATATATMTAEQRLRGQPRDGGPWAIFASAGPVPFDDLPEPERIAHMAVATSMNHADDDTATLLHNYASDTGAVGIAETLANLVVLHTRAFCTRTGAHRRPDASTE